MKKFIVCTIVVAVAIQSIRAQEMPERKSEKIESSHHRDGLHRLNLSEDQKAKFKSLHEDYRKQMQDLKKNDDITVKDWKSRMETLRKDHRDKISSLLTEEQKTQLNKSRQERRRRTGGRKGRSNDLQGMNDGHYGPKTRLNLTEDQKTRLKAIRSEMADKIKSTQENQSLTDDQKKEKVQDLRKKTREDLKKILTEDQLKRLHEKQVRRPAKLPV